MSFMKTLVSFTTFTLLYFLNKVIMFIPTKCENIYKIMYRIYCSEYLYKVAYFPPNLSNSL